MPPNSNGDGVCVSVGCGDGKTYMFNWGEFGYHSAEFPGHPDGINSLIAVTDNVVVTGCEDGVIRAVHLYPHRYYCAVSYDLEASWRKREKTFPPSPYMLTYSWHGGEGKFCLGKFVKMPHACKKNHTRSDKMS